MTHAINSTSRTGPPTTTAVKGNNKQGIVPIPKKSRTIKTDKPRPFLCPTCTRGFVRLEHLKRHERSHTQEKPYLCIFCGRCFARRDLVLRHQTKLHSSILNNSKTYNSLVHQADQHDNYRHIIKIDGNKKTLLPTLQLDSMTNKSNEQLTNDIVNFIKLNNIDIKSKDKLLQDELENLLTTARENGLNLNLDLLLPQSLSVATTTIPSTDNIDPIPFPTKQDTSDTNSTNSSSSQIVTNKNNNTNRQRHASFSASSAFTYTRDIPNIDQFISSEQTAPTTNNYYSSSNTSSVSPFIPDNNNNNMLIDTIQTIDEEAPHQVGFSTPQLTTDQVIEKAVDAGILDYNNMDLPKNINGFKLNLFDDNNAREDDPLFEKQFSDLKIDFSNPPSTSSHSNSNSNSNSNLNLGLNSNLDPISTKDNNNGTDVFHQNILSPRNPYLFTSNMTPQLVSTSSSTNNTSNPPLLSPSSFLGRLPSLTDIMTMGVSTSNGFDNNNPHIPRVRINNTYYKDDSNNNNNNNNNNNTLDTVPLHISHSNSTVNMTQFNYNNVINVPPQLPQSSESSSHTSSSASSMIANTKNTDNFDLSLNYIPKDLRYESDQWLNKYLDQNHKFDSTIKFRNINDVGFYNFNDNDNASTTSNSSSDHHSSSHSYHLNVNNNDDNPSPRNIDTMNLMDGSVSSSFENNKPVASSFSSSCATSNSPEHIDNNISDVIIKHSNPLLSLTNTTSKQKSARSRRNSVFKPSNSNSSSTTNSIVGLHSNMNMTPLKSSDAHSQKKAHSNNSKRDEKKRRKSSVSNSLSTLFNSRQLDLLQNELLELQAASVNELGNDTTTVNMDDMTTTATIPPSTNNIIIPNHQELVQQSNNINTTNDIAVSMTKEFINNLSSTTFSLNSINPNEQQQETSTSLPLQIETEIQNEISQTKQLSFPLTKFSSRSHSSSISSLHQIHDLQFFNEEIRQLIIITNNLQTDSFPTVTELNNYITLYQKWFHKYFPFIHLFSIKQNVQEHIPLLLSMTMIGALFAFHSSHSKFLSIISTVYVKNIVEVTHKNKPVPLWVIQTLLLLTFMGIFTDDLNVIKNMDSQLITLIQLIKENKINLPMETIPDYKLPSFNMLSSDQLFDYFILAQSRIRVCHTTLLLSNFFASLIGIECCFHSIDLHCGLPCQYEILFSKQMIDSNEWLSIINSFGMKLESNFDLIQLSNGFSHYNDCLIYLTDGNQFFYSNSKISLLTSLSLIMSIHEKLFMNYKNNRQDDMEIDSMIKYWENLYLKNSGIITPNSTNMPIIKDHPTIRLIIPLYILVKIRKCLDLSHVMNRVWLQDWDKMNLILEELSYDWNKLTMATNYSILMLDSWVTILKVAKTGSRTNFRTPIFTTTCLFITAFTIAEYLKKFENWALDDNGMAQKSSLSQQDKNLWIKIEKTLENVQKNVLPQHDSMKSYLEFLKLQSTQHHENSFNINPLSDAMINKYMGPNSTKEMNMYIINKAKLSSRCLYLGVRILGDVPIWPIALSFAHALQSRAIFNVLNRKPSFQSDQNIVN
ncbi:Rsf2p NDAI_0J02850 [Naumovozyma dairenensis CBS 421]|uniref:C2H2-type domain-containing protein n=1 Tax=Naumovozyma dairenensis (strain ATCC 10597 / BCRC 20456 / CBS 421 / NBRC 0211 / NRRL Y-12639) TaxID=1071378 RepID=G0WH99_NAUDC|nr:hypothetical protein NDAI_0J02850 [Naumovozyma dairenensis CBS 421]CCD27177.1 hypothetical protein NDAI_0J02850 [Naumovozyma dairenensis CBS 421]